MLIKYFLVSVIVVTALSSAGGCGKESTTVVPADQAMLQAMKEAEEAEKSGQARK